MEELLKAAEAADSGWSVLAIAIIGLYLLAWKFGGELLRLTRDSNEVAKNAHAEVSQVREDIRTNHGSKNLGDAVDRLTEWMYLHMRETQASDEGAKQLREDFTRHMIDHQLNTEKALDRFAEIDERLEAMEQRRR